MRTLKIMVVVATLASAFAVGLAYAWAAIAGNPVSRDELYRSVLLSIVFTGCAFGALRWRSTPRA